MVIAPAIRTPCRARRSLRAPRATSAGAILASPARSGRAARRCPSRSAAPARCPWPSRAATANSTSSSTCHHVRRAVAKPHGNGPSATPCGTSSNAALGYQYCSRTIWEDVMPCFRARPLVALCAMLAVLAFATTDADARAGRGMGFGSRGSQTFSAPPSTTTSPTARPIERSMTQPGQPGGAFAQRPSPVGGFFNRSGFFGGLFAGFLGAGLLGMLFGHGFLGGLAGFASLIGLMLQIGIIVIIGYLVWTWWQRRSQPALANGPALRDYASGNSRPPLGLGGGAARPSARASGTDEVGLTPDD